MVLLTWLVNFYKSVQQICNNIGETAYNFKSFVGVCKKSANNGTALFVFGHSFASNDAHVLDQIGKGNINHLFVSLFGDPKSEENSAIRLRVSQVAARRPVHSQEIKVDFFDAASAQIWG